jgi:dihydroorotase
MTTWLIRGAMIAGGNAGVADMLLKDGSVEAIGAGLTEVGAQVIDGEGLIALPGLVDLHTHLREPGREDAETVETGTAWPTPSPSPIPPEWSSRSGA